MSYIFTQKELLEKIFEVWNETENSMPEHLAESLKEYTNDSIRKGEVESLETLRPDCKGECDNKQFSFIDGSYCKKCGFVLPF
jgi:hypothetical protein